MAIIGTATLNVVPKLSGLSEAVKGEFAKVKAESLGETTGAQYSKGVGSGLVKSGAVVGAFAAITSKALSSISSHIGAAISRFDTLNNYPRVMQSLGYSAQDAESSIAKMSDRLQTLPTTLDSMVSLTQGLAVSTGDLNKATDAALALNDMLLASGSNQQLVNSAQEQFRQILSKGKPDMQDWKSLTMAMPGQLDQLAKAMLGPTANANDLYAALGGGKNEQIISMDQLLDEIIRLDKEGGEGFESFQAQAETASGGVATSMANAGNAITRGIASVLDTIGKENIASFFDDIKGGINTIFGGINSVVSGAMPVIKGLYDVLKQVAPALIAGGAGFAVFAGGANKASAIIGGFKGRIADAAAAAGKSASSFSTLGKITAGLGGSFNIAALGIGAAVTVITMIAGAIQDAQKKQENLTKATTGFNEAVSRAASVGDYAGKVDNLGTSAESTAKSIAELAESTAQSVDKINEISQNAETQIGTLNSAQATIERYVGQTDLSSEAQGELAFALKQVNEQFGLSLTAADVAAGKYTDQNGHVQDLTTSIGTLIEAKKREIEQDALSQQLEEAYKARADAAKTYAEARKSNAQEMETYNQLLNSGQITYDAYTASIAASNRKLEQAESLYKSADDGVKTISADYGDLTKSLSEAANEYDKWGNSVGEAFKAALGSGGLANLKEDLASLGADTTALAQLEESELLKISDAYDGTASSVIGVLGDLGVGMSNVSAETQEMAAQITDAINGLDVATPLGEAGISVDDFALKLTQAGVSTETLNAIGTENLTALAESCGGNVGLMISHIENYNATPLFDKDGRVSADDTTLIDALGNIYTWNGQGLIDQNGQAVINQVELEDAQGNLATWNGSRLEDKQGNALVQGNMAQAISTRNTWNNGDLKSFWAEAHIDVIETRTTQNAAGGYRKNAAGGVRYHADGFIATRATVLPPIDIVGEAGAEAIIPLTNKTYAQPFVDLIAESLSKKSGDGAVQQMLSSACALLGAILEAIPSFSERDAERFVRRQITNV